MYWHLQGMKCCNRTLLCHSQTKHFFPYNPQWFLNLYCCIPLVKVASTCLRSWSHVLAPPRNEMLQQDPILPSRTGYFFSYNLQTDFGLTLLHSTPGGGFNMSLVPKTCISTSKEWNAVVGSYSAIAKLDTFSHKIFNGFYTCELVFRSWRWPQCSLGCLYFFKHGQV